METKHKLNIRDLVRSIHPHTYTNNFFFSVMSTDDKSSFGRLKLSVRVTGLTLPYSIHWLKPSFLSFPDFSVQYSFLSSYANVLDCFTNHHKYIHILKVSFFRRGLIFLLLNPDMVINKSNIVAFRNQISQFTVKYITTINPRKKTRKLVNNDIPKYREENQNSSERQEKENSVSDIQILAQRSMYLKIT